MKHLVALLFPLLLAAWPVLIALLRKRYAYKPANGIPLIIFLLLLPVLAVLPSGLLIPIVALTVLSHTLLLCSSHRDSLKINLPIFIAFFLVCAFEYSFFTTYGTFEILGKESFGAAFDSLAASLLKAHADIDLRAIKWEGYFNHNRVYTYFGPFPAFLRIFLNAFTQNQAGLWPRFSILTAALFSFSAFISIVHRELSKLQSIDATFRTTLFHILILGFGAGTPLVFLTSCSFIYHEAHIWGFCFGIWSIYFLIPLIDDYFFERNKDPRFFSHLYFFSLCAGCALLSRVTYSIPLFIFLSVLGIFFVIKRPRESKELLIATSPAVAAFLMQLWYNQERFDSPFEFNNFHLYRAYVGQHHESIYDIGGPFNLIRLPFAFKQYFLHFQDSFSTQFPFFYLHEARHFLRRTYPSRFPSGAQMQLIAYPIVSPWLLVLAVPGLYQLIKKGAAWWRLCGGVFLVQVLMIASYYWVCQRYMMEFLPLFVTGTVFFIRYSLEGLFQRESRSFLHTMSFLVLFSVTATLLSTLEYVSRYRDGVPEGYTDQLKDSFDEIEAKLSRLKNDPKEPFF